MKFSILAIFTSAALLVASANAAVTIANFNFNDNTFSSSDTESSTTTSIIVGNSLSESIGDPNIAGDFKMAVDQSPFQDVTTRAFSTSYGQVGAGGASGALAAGDYASFTISSIGGASMDFTNITFNLTQLSLDNGATPGKPATVHVFAGDYSVTGPAIGDLIGSSSGPSRANTGQYVLGDIDLSSLSSTSDPIEFRLYIDDDGATSNHTIAIDDIIVNGTVTPVPEPSIAVLFLCGIPLMMLRRRVP